jgi:hypothetical protein
MHMQQPCRPAQKSVMTLIWLDAVRVEHAVFRSIISTNLALGRMDTLRDAMIGTKYPNV